VGPAALTLTARALSAGLGVLALTAHAAADEDCVEVAPDGLPFATCFDPGNRLVVSAGSDGYGGGLWLRHRVTTGDPEVVWRLEHVILNGAGTADAFRGAIYVGRYLRHSRDGRIVLPLGPPRSVFLPFDIGAEAQVGLVEGSTDDARLAIGVVRAAALVDLARVDHVRRRFAVGIEARWDLDYARDRAEVDRHRVSPFSTLLVDFYAESTTGLSLAHLRAEGGVVWSSDGVWSRHGAVAADLERVVLAVNDHPLSLFASARVAWTEPTAVGVVGVRFALTGEKPRLPGQSTPNVAAHGL
jgi:hypothetical protein